VGEWSVGLEGALDDDDSGYDGPSDDDIIQSVRTTIFGAIQGDETETPLHA
jgi:hypothetical protein